MVTFSLTWQYINTSLSSSIRNHIHTHYLLFPWHIMGHSLGKPKLLTAKFKLMPQLFCHLPFVFSPSMTRITPARALWRRMSMFLLMRWQPWRSWWESSSLQIGFNLKPLFKPFKTNYSNSACFDHFPGLNRQSYNWVGGNEGVCVSGQLKDHTGHCRLVGFYLFSDFDCAFPPIITAIVNLSYCFTLDILSSAKH